MASVREILTKWSFNVEHEKLDHVEHQLEQIKHRLEFLAAAEVMRGVYELTERFAHFAEELHVAASSAGLTVEAFQKLAFAAGQSGISQDEMAMSMARLSRHLYDARKGGEEAQKAFAAAGFQPGQIASFKTGQDVMLALADRMKNMTDPIQKQALAMQLMGRGSVNMVGFLSQGSGAIRGMGDEASRLGAILSGEQVEALVKTEHSLQKLWAVVKNIVATFVAYLSPAITSAIDAWLKFYSANKKLIEVNIKEWAYDIGYALGAVTAMFEFVTKKVFDFVAAHGLLVRRIGEVLLITMAMIGGFFALMKVVELLKSAFGVLGTGFSFLMSLGKGALWVFRMLSTILPVVIQFFMDFAAVVLASPIGWIALATVAIHDLWVLLNGGSFEDTWLGQAFRWLEKMGSMVLQVLGLKDALSGGITGVGDFLGGLKDKVSGAFKGAVDMTGLQNVMNVGGIGGTPSGIAGPAPNSSSYAVNSPITVNIDGHADPKVVAKSVQDGVREHLDRVHRDAQRSLKPVQAY